MVYKINIIARLNLPVSIMVSVSFEVVLTSGDGNVEEFVENDQLGKLEADGGI